MTDRAKILKDIVKKNPEPAKGTNVDPGQLGQYSAKYQVSESPTLDRYLLARGYNPRNTPKDIKIAHSKSNAFKTWQQQHMNETSPVERISAVDKKTQSDSEMSYARQNKVKHIPSHEIKNPPGTMKREDVESLDELSINTLASYKKKAGQDVNRRALKGAMYKDDPLGHPSTPASREQNLKKRSSRVVSIVKAGEKLKSKGHQEPKPADDKGDRGYGKGRYMGDSVEFEDDVLDEAGMSAAVKLSRAWDREKAKSQASRERANKMLDSFKKPKDGAKKPEGSQNVQLTPEDANYMAPKANFVKKELKGILDRKKPGEISFKEASDMMGDPKSATISPADGSPKEDNTQRKMSKGARLILDIKKKSIKEDLYDHEKADKSVATYGKKPKLDTADKFDETGKEKPKAAAVMTGGTTLTGQNRDTVEIDPAMRVRPGQPDPTKDKDKDKDKDKKKDEKKKE